MGYHRAGFEVIGVDIEPQPNYPFEFRQADALTYPLDGFDAIHASPPCQCHCSLRALSPHKNYVDLIPPTRSRLIEHNEKTGVPYVIENVVGAPLLNPVQICGKAVGLTLLRRHRRFESNVLILVPECAHPMDDGDGLFPALDAQNRRLGRRSNIVGVYGKGGDKRADLWPTAMGIDWMTREELTQAIPPAYTELIGGHLLTAIRSIRNSAA